MRLRLIHFTIWYRDLRHFYAMRVYEFIPQPTYTARDTITNFHQSVIVINGFMTVFAWIIEWHFSINYEISAQDTVHVKFLFTQNPFILYSLARQFLLRTFPYRFSHFLERNVCMFTINCIKFNPNQIRENSCGFSVFETQFTQP